jgi:precorrin-6B methylase 2
MLIGTFECDLAPVIEGIVSRGFARIVNVGAGEGYYAIGLARRISSAAVYAFEMDASVRFLLEGTAAANHVTDRVRSGESVSLPTWLSASVATGKTS